MAPLRGLTLCHFAKSCEGVGGWGWHCKGTEQGLWWPFPRCSPHHPHPDLDLDSVSTEKHWAYPAWHLLPGWGKAAQISSCPVPKRAVNLTHHPFLGEVEWAEGGLAACTLPRGGVGGQSCGVL